MFDVKCNIIPGDDGLPRETLHDLHVHAVHRGVEGLAPLHQANDTRMDLPRRREHINGTEIAMKVNDKGTRRNETHRNATQQTETQRNETKKNKKKKTKQNETKPKTKRNETNRNKTKRHALNRK